MDLNTQKLLERKHKLLENSDLTGIHLLVYIKGIEDGINITLNTLLKMLYNAPNMPDDVKNKVSEVLKDER